MKKTTDEILQEVRKHVIAFFDKKIANRYAYHNLEHTKNVVEVSKEIGQHYELEEEELFLLELAAWFHDIGYDLGPVAHEERGVQYAFEFLKPYQLTDQQLATIRGCIVATRYEQNPNNLLEEILCDADLGHLGKETYWDRCGKVRQELSEVQGRIMGEAEWIDFELGFMQKHDFHTECARQLFNKKKEKHIRQLIKRKSKLDSAVLTQQEEAILEKKKLKKKIAKQEKNQKKELKQLRLGRGVETMYRTTYRTHVNLSSIADNKANIMLSINAIIISITVSTMVPNFSDTPKLIIPTLILLGVCLVSIVFATLSTMPKVTEGVFTREDIQQKRSNLLFFGNFYNMDLEDFHWGMMEMIKDSDFLYSSMTRDLYFLGKVLAKKYNYLRICYRIFMYGLIISVLAFALTFAF